MVCKMLLNKSRLIYFNRINFTFNCLPKNQDNFPSSFILQIEFSLVLSCIRYASVFEATNISCTHNNDGYLIVDILNVHAGVHR